MDTPIPTPYGWCHIGELRAGDIVFDERGEPTEVVAVSKIEKEPESFRLTFDDGATIDACGDHRWVTFDAVELAALTRRDQAWRARRRAGRSSRAGSKKSAAFRTAVARANSVRSQAAIKPAPTGSVRTTAEIAQTLRSKSGRTNHAVQVAGPLSIPTKRLPLDPYLLGVWLGDGTSAAGAVTTADTEIAQAFGNAIRQPSMKYGYGVPGLATKLRAIGVLGNKHIPTTYLRSSRPQRLALLQGLMDTDGMACRNGSVEFTNGNRALADAVAELACSLGHKARVRVGSARLNGRIIGPHYHVKWAAPEVVFRLRRKAHKQKLAVRRTQRFRYIVACERIVPRPMRCITVAAKSGLYLAGREMIPTHNSDALLVDAVRYVGRGHGSAYHAILFRRTFPELEKSLIKRSWDLYPILGGTYNEQKKLWRFPGGERVEFAHLEHVNDVHIYQGAEFQFIGFDELTSFSESQYLYLFSRCRSSKGVRCRVRAGTNPGNDGHEWVFRRWGPWLDPDSSVHAEPGQELFFVRMNDIDSVVPRGTPLARDRTFIPARLEDNPPLFLDGQYEATLAAMDRVTRERLRKGDWLIKPARGLYFRRDWFKFVNPDEVPVEARRCRYWDRAATEAKKGNDPDWTVGARLALTPDKRVYIEDVSRMRGNPGDVEKFVKATAELDGTDVRIGLEQEPGASGKADVAAYIRLLYGWNVRAFPKRVNKIVASGPVSAQAEAGNVYMVRGPWNEPVIAVLEQFPEAAHDDDPDAISGAYTMLADVPVRPPPKRGGFFRPGPSYEDRPLGY